MQVNREWRCKRRDGDISLPTEDHGRGPASPVRPDVARARRNSATRKAAFTLIEVMIAGGILFACLFAILALVANSLRNARALQRLPVDAGMLAAELSLTNRLEEGSDSGDFGDLYRDYEWRRRIYEVDTNGLFEVDFTVIHRTDSQPVESHMSILLYRPNSTRRPGR